MAPAPARPRRKGQIILRLQWFGAGQFGDSAGVGHGVIEARIHVGPGYRIYYVLRGTEVIVLLCGGDKSTQERDIQAARRLAKELDP